MKNPFFIFALLILALGVVPGVARADVYEVGPLYNISHDRLYAWKIAGIETIQDDEFIASATLTISGLTNWANESWKLWVNLMDQKGTGTWSSVADPSPELGNDLLTTGWGGTQLGAVVGTTTAATTWSIDFNQAQLAALTTYINNGNNISFGFDPDCHFDLSLITFEMNVRDEGIPNVPEPGSIVLLGTCLLVGGGALRRRLRA